MEWTWLAVDAPDRVLGFWTDKRGAHPESGVLLEMLPAKDQDVLSALLGLERRAE